MSTLNSRRSRLLIPITSTSSSSAVSSSSSSWTSTTVSRSSDRACSSSSGELLGLERGDDQQHGVGAVDRRLDELVLVDDEVLAKQRQLRRGPRGAQVLQRAAEAAVLGQDRERRRTAPLVGRDQVGDLGAGPDLAGARRSPLELGDQRDARAAPAPP